MNRKLQLALRIFVSAVASFSTAVVIMFASLIPKFIHSVPIFRTEDQPGIFRVVKLFSPMLPTSTEFEYAMVVLLILLFWFYLRAFERHQLGALSCLLALVAFFVTSLICVGGSVAMLYECMCDPPEPPGSHQIITYTFSTVLFLGLLGAIANFEFQAWRRRSATVSKTQAPPPAPSAETPKPS
ncbi:hypothetical protein LBMAG56_44970 [Verrucomicrobiota bacterium]|nr:hypothetical protein LBMAG56_44970 [Verrucomicrobiota bacterium]